MNVMKKLVFDGEYVSTQKINNFNTEVLTCMSLSKTYAMTGWRIGYTLGNTEIIRAMSKLQARQLLVQTPLGKRLQLLRLPETKNV